MLELGLDPCYCFHMQDKIPVNWAAAPLVVPSSTLCRLEILSNAAEHRQITEEETNKSTAAILVINFTSFFFQFLPLQPQYSL